MKRGYPSLDTCPKPPQGLETVLFLHNRTVPSTQTSEKPKGPVVRDEIQSPEPLLSLSHIMLESGVDFFIYFFCNRFVSSSLDLSARASTGRAVDLCPSSSFTGLSPSDLASLSFIIYSHCPVSWQFKIQTVQLRKSVAAQWKIDGFATFFFFFLMKSLKIIFEKNIKPSVRALCFCATECHSAN